MSLAGCCTECDKQIPPMKHAPCGDKLCDQCCAECNELNYEGDCPERKAAQRRRNANRSK